jgi:hypothetical protein
MPEILRPANLFQPANPRGESPKVRVCGEIRKMEAFRNPTVKGNKELLEWCSPWDPESFDVESSDQLLRVQ